MPSPAEVLTESDSELGDDGVVEMEDDERGDERHGRDGARVPAAEGGDEGVGAGRPPVCCSVCMESWTCCGAHRICCIPCGHVYGRSCLERWLQHCGSTSSKCPQCGERFELKHITNLYAPGNLWDGCCRIEVFDAHIAEAKAQIAEEMEKLRSELVDLFHSRSLALLSDVQQVYQKQLDHDVGVMVKAFVSMKEQMKKMVEQNAMPMDLIEFLEQSYTQLPIPSRPPAEGGSEVQSA